MALEHGDEERIRTMVQLIKETPAIDILRLLLPESPDTTLSKLERKMAFLHGGLLVFPAHPLDIQRLLTELEMTIFFIAPSFIVRQRLAQRYQIDEEQLDIHIIMSSYQRKDGEIRILELFTLLHQTPGITDAIREAERAEQHEDHVAFAPHDPSDVHNILDLFKASGFENNGGGINPFENARTTVTYLLHPTQKRRIELQTSLLDL